MLIYSHHVLQLLEGNMRARCVGFTALALTGLIAVGSHGVQAEGIDGVWVTDAAVCQKVFEKKGSLVSFVKGSDIYGNGFIIDGNQIRGRIATCNVKARRQQGPVVNIIAVCSTDIAVDTAQFRLRVEGPNKVVREFPGMPDMEINYHRCSM
jgi:hypothetical protein